MINQQESPPLEPQPTVFSDFIEDLLQEPLPLKEQMEPTRMKQPLEVNFLNEEEGEVEQEKQRIGFSLLEMEDSNNLLAYQPFPEPDDDAIPNNSLPISSPIIKKDSKFQRLAYLEETRVDKIQRYRRKKCRRVWDRKISYDCRKVVADSRARVNGRFAKKKSPLVPATDSKTPQFPSPLDLLDHPAPPLEDFTL